ncbi:DUF2927 domain-containing protein [uncultured Lentibacter sp.]|uniref:DUF2927 domain-containing protein n=1 Tax=uncultured Lentibacter sp. TaxID=1659309 RepID=UPI00260C568B|nr:DUF2927 domain-containing protein [uncultured Lentibacter sp.]
MARTRRLFTQTGAALFGLSLLPLLAGCDFAGRTGLKPAARPALSADQDSSAQQAAPSGTSRALAAYYQKLETRLLAQGLLRRDGGGPDTAFDARDLADNFAAIAFYDEHSTGTFLKGTQALSRFHPWRGPVRFEAHFGPSVPAATRTADRATIKSYAARLARVTAHPVSMAPDGNFHILVMSADDGPALRDTIARVWPEFPQARIERLLALPRDIYCLVHTNTPSAPQGHERAIALIRAEHPPLMRLSCLHEELAQGLGLSNDSPLARPSIFNDDEEFATLTSHDELLLKMLYDPRLRSGMSLTEARPVITDIAAGLAGAPDARKPDTATPDTATPEI